MGKVANFARSRHQDAREKRDQRTHRSQVERDKRLGVDQENRKLQRVVVQRKLPSDSDRKLLLDQFTQACRLPAPSSDLCLLIRHYAGGSVAERRQKDTEDVAGARGSKRARDDAEEEEGGPQVKPNPAGLNSLADVFVSTVSAPVIDGDDNDDDDDDDDPMTVLLAILQNEYGRRVVSALLGALHDTRGCEAKCLEVSQAVLDQFEENEHLAEHHVACRVLSVLVQCGPKEVRQGVLNLLRQRCMDLDGVKALLRDRHTSVTVENLLEAEAEATSQWLSEVLGLAAAPASSASSSAKGKGKAKKAAATGAVESLTEEELMKLIEDPVSGQVVRQLINPTTRPQLLARLDVSTLLASKRGTSFLSALLTVPAAEKTTKASPENAAAFAATLDKLLSQTGAKLDEMSIDRQANFVVQKIILLAPHTPAKKQPEYFSQIVHILGNAAGLQALANHHIGVHVLCTLVDAALQSDAAVTIADDIGGSIVTKSNVAELAGSQHGSMVVRRLMPLAKKGANTSSKVGHLLMSAVEQNLSSLMYDPIGNLVVQEYIKAIGQADASAFARKLKKEDLVAMSRNQFASHVVYAMLDSIDATTHVAVCNLLRPFVPTLAVHLNGRFIVEKLIPASRDVRDELVRQFLPLAMERGTQHVLCTLMANMDPRGKQNLIDNVIVPGIRDLSTNSCGSIVLQKLMQGDADVLAAVQKRLRSDTFLANELAQTFSGKFVVQIAVHGVGQSTTAARPPAKKR